jgi:PAS domain S-box-containing protein
VSLLSERQFVASLAGMQPSEAERTGPRDASLCTVTARGQGPLAVSDAAHDARVNTLPPVTSGAVGAYLGVPLVDGAGLLLGALCVYDERPRTWSPEHVGTLAELAAAVVAELELRAVTLEVATSAAQLDLALSAADIGSFDWDLTTDELHWDDRLLALFGYDRVDFRPHISSFSERIHPDDAGPLDEVIARALSTGEYSADYRIVLPDGEVRWVEARGKVLRGGPGRSDRMLGAAYDATARHLVQAQRESAYREREQAVVERERAYARAEAATHRLAVLADATTQLSASLEPGEVLETLAGVLLPALGRWMAIAVPAEQAGALLPVAPAADPRQVQAVFVRHGDGRQQEALDRFLKDLPFSLDDVHGPGAVIRTGVTELLPQVTEQVVRSFSFDEDDVSRALELQVGTALTVPMVSRGRRIAALTVAEPASGPLDQALLQDLAGRAAVALDNALAYRAERRTGITLQRSLLPRDVPRVPGLEVAARYLPGADGAFVGGDWYQGVPVDGRLVLAMGDVMGHGMRSAARMGQLRAIVATLALEGHLPGELLQRLARNCDSLLDLELATLLVASYDPATGLLTAASAGHPPPLLAALGGEPAFVDVEPGPPLGTLLGDYEEIQVEVPPGATLLLYTDGLVENRSEPLSQGLERLRQALRDVQLPPEHVADHVLEVTGREQGADDDVALLVVSRVAT